MKRIAILSFFIFIIITSSCIYSTKLNSYNEYKEIKTMLTIDLMDHFKEVDNKYAKSISIQKPYNSSYNEGVEIIVFLQIKDKYLKNIEDCSPIYSVTDTCNLLANNLRKGFIVKESDCKYNKIPIPNYNHWGLNLTGQHSKIPHDLKFYLKKAESGIFLPDTLLTVGGGLPLEWRNGYSKGYAISESENKFVYWLIVW